MAVKLFWPVRCSGKRNKNWNCCLAFALTQPNANSFRYYNSVASRDAVHAQHSLLVRDSIISVFRWNWKTTIDWCVADEILRSSFSGCLMNARTAFTSENCLLLQSTHVPAVPTYTYLLVLSCSFFHRISFWRRFDGRTDTSIANKHIEVYAFRHRFLWRLPLCCGSAIHASTHTRAGREHLRSPREQQQINWHMCCQMWAPLHGQTNSASVWFGAQRSSTPFHI